MMGVGMGVRSGREGGKLPPSPTSSYNTKTAQKRTSVWAKMLAIVQINEYNIRCR